MNNPLISIIVPVYNVEDYLEECVLSVANQTYANIEIILIDDGSVDSSPQICESLVSQDERIRVIHKENGGLSSARNVGIEYARGSYYVFVDSDDLISQSMISDMVCGAINTNTKIVVSPLTSVRERIHHSNSISANYSIVKSSAILKSIISEREITTSASGKLFDSELWKEIRFPEGKLFEDFATIYKVVLQCDSICLINNSYYYYRPNPSGITKSSFTRRKLDYFDISESIREDLIRKGYNSLITDLDNRAVRYSISFFRDLSRSGNRDEETIGFLSTIVKGKILQYLISRYKITSKMYGLLITLSPTAAIKLFRENR